VIVKIPLMARMNCIVENCELQRKTKREQFERTKNWKSEGKTKPIVLKTIRLPNSKGTRLMNEAATGFARTTAESDPNVVAVVRRGATVCSLKAVIVD